MSSHRSGLTSKAITLAWAGRRSRMYLVMTPSPAPSSTMQETLLKSMRSMAARQRAGLERVKVPVVRRLRRPSRRKEKVDIGYVLRGGGGGLPAR